MATLREKIIAVLKEHGESFIDVDQVDLDQAVLDQCTTDIIHAIFHQHEKGETYNRAAKGYRIRDLMGNLAVYYDSNVPVEFTSSESGGNWPRGRKPMFVFVDEQVALHGQAAERASHLGISLLNREEDRRTTVETHITKREASYLLAGLRAMQIQMGRRGLNAAAVMDIATEHGTMGLEEIDALCQRVNFGVVRIEGGN